jgi:hypothetical protein
MIAVKIYGGLGNQLFQYSAGRSLAIQKQTELVLDLSWYKNRPKSNTERHFELLHFKINARTATTNEERFHEINRPNIKNLFRKKNLQWFYCKEKNFEYMENFHTLPDNTYLDGYWQSYKYFENIQTKLKKELKLNHGLQNSTEYEVAIKSSNSVAIHVRRGDYVSNPSAANYHGLCSEEYYVKSIEIIKKIIVNPQFFIFSDDLGWVKENMKLINGARYVETNQSQSGIYEFLLMSYCKHFIIANSTYSWWSAWLSSACAEKITIAPKKWFNTEKNTRTLLPEQWIRI